MAANDRGITMHHLLLRLSGAIPRDRDQRGATAAEYALIIGLCVLAFVGSIAALRIALGSLHDGTQDSIDNWP